MGRGWIKQLDLQWAPEPQIHHIKEETLKEVLREHVEVFKEELGRFNGPPAKIYVDMEATHRFFKARPVPYTMRGRVETELDRLLAKDIGTHGTCQICRVGSPCSTCP